MRVIVVGGSMRSPVSLMLVLYYLDDVADGVGESDIVMVTSVVASSSRTWCSSAKRPIFNKTRINGIIPLPCMLPLMQHRESRGLKLVSPEENTFG